MSKQSERYPVSYSKLIGKVKQMFVCKRDQLIKFDEIWHTCFRRQSLEILVNGENCFNEILNI